MFKSIRQLWNRQSAQSQAGQPSFFSKNWTRFKAAVRRAPWRRWLRFAWVAPGLERITTIILRLGTLLLVGFFLIFFLRLFRDQGYVIQSVSVPKQLMEQGYTGQVVALRIQDQLLALKEQAGSIKEDSLELKGDQQDIDLSVLGVGLSLKSLAFQLREVLGRENKTVRSEITRIDDQYEAQLRMTGYDKINAKVKVKNGQEAEALEELFKRVAEGILYQTDPYRLALVQRKEKRYDEAVATIRHYLQAREDEAHWAYLCWGSMLSELNDTEGAIEKFERAIEIKPDFSLPYVHLAWAYEEVGQTDAAIATFKKVIALEPENVWRRNNLAWLYFDNDMPEQADSVYQDIFETMNLEGFTKADVASSWAEMKLQDDNIAEAKRIIDEYVDEYSENVFSYLIRGVATFAEQDTSAALELLENAFELDPGHPGSIGANMGFNLMVKRYDRVVHFFEDADWSEISEGNRMNNYNQAAMAYNFLEQHDSAQAVIQRAIAIDPDQAFPYTTLAETYFFKGARDTCFHYLELALEMGFDPDDFNLDTPPYPQLAQTLEFQRLMDKYQADRGQLKN